MRMLLKASIPVEAGNAGMRDGRLQKTIQSWVAQFKPEAAYFIEEQGKRTAILVVDLQHPSQIPGMAEPWFLALNAAVEFHPAMTAEDLAKAGPDIEKAVKNS